MVLQSAPARIQLVSTLAMLTSLLGPQTYAMAGGCRSAAVVRGHVPH